MNKFLFLFAVSVATLNCTVQNDPNVIYAGFSNDNWGTSTDRDTIDNEYYVALTKTTLIIQERVAGSVFFKNYVGTSGSGTIVFDLESGGIKSNEYWATLSQGSSRLMCFGRPIAFAFVQGNSGMVRLIFRLTEGGGDEVYYFWPASEN